MTYSEFRNNKSQSNQIEPSHETVERLNTDLDKKQTQSETVKRHKGKETRNLYHTRRAVVPGK